MARTKGCVRQMSTFESGKILNAVKIVESEVGVWDRDSLTLMMTTKTLHCHACLLLQSPVSWGNVMICPEHQGNKGQRRGQINRTSG